jgi:VanZ family protein
MKRIILWILTLAWGVLIWRLTTTPDFKVTEDTLLSLLISNGGHFIFFGVQAALVFISLPGKIKQISPSVLAVIASSTYGLMIEYVQRTIPGRSADPIDWMLDTVGAITFLAIMKTFLNLKS